MHDVEPDGSDVLEASIRAWVHDEHPDDAELARRAGRLAVELSQRGVALADVCRTVFAFVADQPDRSMPR